jgi:hypothetical protein
MSSALCCSRPSSRRQVALIVVPCTRTSLQLRWYEPGGSPCADAATDNPASASAATRPPQTLISISTPVVARTTRGPDQNFRVAAECRASLDEPAV